MFIIIKIKIPNNSWIPSILLIDITPNKFPLDAPTIQYTSLFSLYWLLSNVQSILSGSGSIRLRHSSFPVIVSIWIKPPPSDGNRSVRGSTFWLLRIDPFPMNTSRTSFWFNSIKLGLPFNSVDRQTIIVYLKWN